MFFDEADRVDALLLPWGDFIFDKVGRNLHLVYSFSYNFFDIKIYMLKVLSVEIYTGDDFS